MISRLRSHLVQMLRLRETPRRTALAFAIGVAIAFSPTYGLHTASVLFCAWAFRLNFLALMTGSLLNNPWTLAPILALTFWTGFKITGVPPTSFDLDGLSLTTLYQQVLPYLIPFLTGGIVLSLIGGVVSYPFAHLLISRYRARRPNEALEEQPLRSGTDVG